MSSFFSVYNESILRIGNAQPNSRNTYLRAAPSPG